METSGRFAGGSHFVFPLSFSIGESTSLAGDSLRSCSTSLWQQHVQSVGAMLSLVWSDRIDPFQVEAMCYLQETHGVDMLQNYTPTGHCSSHSDMGPRDWSAW